MTVVGSDNFADAPLLEVGTSSAYTPNAGYSTESGEPTAWGGKTAWWKVIPTVSEFHYIDVLYSTGSTRAWVYRQDGSGFGGLLMVNNPGADTQGGWNANAGSTYYIRLDSDGADVSYVASVGMIEYDEITERRYLTAPRVDGAFPEVREDHFTPGVDVTGPPAAWYYGKFDDKVTGGGASTAVMQVGAWADEVVDEWFAETGDPSWYDDNPDEHPIIAYGVSSSGTDDISAPDGYDLARAYLAMQIWATSGPDLAAEVDGDVPQVQIDGAFDVLTPVRYYDEFGSPAGDVPITGTPTEFRFTMPASPSSSDVEFYYNDGSLLVHFRPNIVGNPGDPFPVGTWYVGYTAIDFVYQSDDPLPYEPPPPPLLVSYVRQHPTAHAGTWGGTPRIYPPPKVQRIYGGHT